MIRNYKPFNISKIDIANLKNVEPYWNKMVLIQTKKLRKWVIKFKKNPDDFKILFPVKYDNYDQLFTQIDNWIHFYNQKFNLIKSNLRILKKFYKLTTSYVSILGWVKSIEFICNFYTDIQTKDIEKRKEHALRLINNILFKNFEIYKKEVYAVIESDDYINLLFSRIFMPKNYILRVDEVAKKVLNYVKILKKKNKINETEFINICVSTIELIIYSLSFSSFSSEFLKNIY